MAGLRTARLELLTSKEIAEYLKKDDLAVLPVGCIEMHGPVVPLGCDLFLDWAAAILMAEEWGCPVLPPIPYVYPGASGPWPGTIDVSPEVSIAYVKEVAKAAIKTGFKRLVISGMHGPLGFMMQSVIRSIYQETGHAVAYINAYDNLIKALNAEFGWSEEDLLMLGSLKVLGWEKEVPLETKLDIEKECPSPVIPALARSGVKVPWLYTKGSQHCGIHARLRQKDASRVVACMKKAIGAMADVPGLFAKYQKELAAAAADPPWTKPGVWRV